MKLFSQPYGWTPVTWSKVGALRWLARTPLKTGSTPTLILSLPRSGSSWVGSVTGEARNSMYLREPLTQTSIKSGATAFANFYVDPDGPPVEYQKIADYAFAGIPLFTKDIVLSPSQWPLFKRARRQTVIKEVNPLALERLIKRYRPRVVFLVRHPAAVASSYQALGWERNEHHDRHLFHEDLVNNRLRRWKSNFEKPLDFWAWQGMYQGFILRYAMDTLAGYANLKTILYEDLCADPVKEFRELFEFCGLDWDLTTENAVLGTTQGGSRVNPYTTARNTAHMAQSWKNDVDPRQRAEIRTEFNDFELPFYGTDEDWN